MKYLIILCDGMADKHNKNILGGKTPMEVAYKPNMDRLAAVSEVGMCRTVADGLKPGSDVANLSVMGYDPTVCYSGRSPLEAASIGVELKPTDVALRCNLVTLSDEKDYEQKRMLDYCGGEISTPEAKKLIESVQSQLGSDIYRFYAGIQYRHCLVVDGGTTELGNMVPPHDISGKVIGEYLSTADTAQPLIELMKKSYDILKCHPVNVERIKRGLSPANAIWLWGEGRKPQLENFKEKNGVSGTVISAVDLLKGIGICAGMDTPEVPGTTGYIDTDFSAKVNAAKQAFSGGSDLVYLHFEAPDECGHRGEAENKVKAIELIDRLVVGEMVEFLKTTGDFRILIMPDHPTPLEILTHSSDPVPYLIFDSRKKTGGTPVFTENNARQTGVLVEHGPDIMKKLLQKM